MSAETTDAGVGEDRQNPCRCVHVDGPHPIAEGACHYGPGDCDCFPAEPDAGDVEALGDLLAEHDAYRVNEDGWTVCICGHVAVDDDDDGSHARHLAAILASDWLDAVRRKAADDRAEQIAQAIEARVAEFDRAAAMEFADDPHDSYRRMAYQNAAAALRADLRIARESR